MLHLHFAQPIYKYIEMLYNGINPQKPLPTGTKFGIIKACLLEMWNADNKIGTANEQVEKSVQKTRQITR